MADPGQLWQEDSQEDPYAHHLQNILLHLTAGLEPDDESLTFGESADLASDRWIGDLQHQAFSSLKEFYSSTKCTACLLFKCGNSSQSNVNLKITFQQAWMRAIQEALCT